MLNATDSRIMLFLIRHSIRQLVHGRLISRKQIRYNHPALPAILLDVYFDDFFDSTADMELTCRWLKRAIARDNDTW